MRVFHPATADHPFSLFAYARFDGPGDAGSDGGNTDEDPDTFSSGFTPSLSESAQIGIGNLTGMDVSELAALRATMGPFAPIAVGMSALRAAAEEAGIDVQDPTTNGFGGAGPIDYTTLLDAIEGGQDVDLVLQDDFTKRIDSPENYAMRRQLSEIYTRAREHSGGSSLWDWREAGGDADAQFLQETFGNVYSGMDEDDWDWNQPGNVWRFLQGKLQDENFSPYAVVDRDFGKLAGFNKTLAGDYRDFLGDFSEGAFAEYATEAGIWDEVNAKRDTFFGENDDLNMALAQRYNYDQAFDGSGGFWAEMERRGEDLDSINSFINAFNGAAPVNADSLPDVYSPTGDSDTQSPAGGSDTQSPAGGGDVGYIPDGYVDATFQPWTSYQAPTFTLPDLDLSFLDVPAATSVQDEVASAVSDELQAQEDRVDILDHIIPLPTRTRRQTSGLSFDIGRSGINFL